MTDAPDVVLLERIAAGDAEAVAALMQRHGGYLYGVACTLVRDRHEAQDVVQETFAAVLKARYRGESSVRTWLVGIVVRQAAWHRRRRRPWLRFWGGSDQAPPEPAGPDPQSASDARMDLADLLDRLPPEHREVIVLRELEGMTYQQIATLLGVPRGTVESRLHRARQQLRQAWEDRS